ncbi:MAG: AAA family ATPase, partial [Cyanobacteria bacterium P01_H01_bin.153]
PLSKADQIEKFQVKYGQQALRNLSDAILASEVNGKLIFTGHRGSGKSTLLVQLAEQMKEAGFYVARFSIADMVEMSDVNHINILYSIALKLLSQATKRQMPIPEGTKKALINWFTQTKSREYTDQLKQELGVGVDFYGLFSGKLQREGAFREIIRETYERRVSELSEQINKIAATIQTTRQKEVVVIIDDLDKLDLDVVRPIFQDNVKALFSPQIRIVFTIPVAVIREPRLVATLESDSTIIMLPVTKFYGREEVRQASATPIEANVTTLQRLLEKRIPEELIEPEIKREIVLSSGGVLRELVRIGQECCRICMARIDPEQEDQVVKINADILQEAVKNLRNQFARTLGSDRLELLKITYENFAPPNAKSSEFLELLHSLYVLEYENDDLWYDLHPLVADILRRRQLI